MRGKGGRWGECMVNGDERELSGRCHVGWFGCRGSREYEEILNFINEQITPHLRQALRAAGALRCAVLGHTRDGALGVAALWSRME